MERQAMWQEKQWSDCRQYLTGNSFYNLMIYSALQDLLTALLDYFLWGYKTRQHLQKQTTTIQELKDKVRDEIEHFNHHHEMFKDIMENFCRRL